MTRMDEKRRRANLRRRNTAFAIFSIALMLMSTVVFSAGTKADEPPQPTPNYTVDGVPQSLDTENVRQIPIETPVPTDTPEMAVILADGLRVGALDTAGEAQYVLDSLLAYFTAQDETMENVAFAQEVQVVSLPKAGRISSPEELYLKLRDDIVAAAQGDKTPPIGITATRVETVTERIDYDTVYFDDDSMAEGAVNVHTNGVRGKRRATYVCTYINGMVAEREMLSETVLKEPVSRVSRRGTAQIAAQPGADGTVPVFMMPVDGRISSYYGERRGRMHYGLDVPMPEGTELAAALGGEVTFAGERGNYGLLVEIDHGNGFVTRYGHNSKNLVKVGQKVSKGQTIALVGNTGNSACPHVHFEIRLHGAAVDPFPYFHR